MSDPTKAVFLSYASQDAEAVQRIAEALRAAGVEVWFDRNELVGGDAWDAKIRKQIAECALFVPVISAQTQARLEGYFRIEWKLAARRTHAMAAAKAFLLPVVIDATRDAEAHVPDEFREVQWTRLPGGEASASFVARLARLVTGAGPMPPAAAPSPGETAAPAGVGDYVRETTTAAAESYDSLLGRSRAAWKRLSPGARLVLSTGFALLGLGIGLLAGRGGRGPASAGAPAVAAVAAGQDSEARRLVAQARKIYDEGDELDRENLLLAEDLVKRALALDASEPSAWVLAAQLSYWLVWHSSDPSRERRTEMIRQAARARALAPDSVEAQLVQANARIAMAYESFGSAGNRQDLIDLERELRALAERAPRHPEVQRSLSQTYRFLQRSDDALRALRQALEWSEGDPAVSADLVNTLIRRKNYPEAEAIISSALARRRTGRLVLFDLLFKTQWRGDLAAARAALANWPGWLLREDRGAYIAWQAWLWSREPDRALDAVQRLPRDYLRDVWFTGPRAVLTARAHELAGHREAALTDWRTAVQLADRELASSPGNAPALFWKAWALSRLGDQPGADAAVTLLEQNRGSQTVFFNTTNLALLWSTLGRTDQAIEHLRAWASTEHDGHAVTRAMLELDPAYENLRKDPRFAALAATALAPSPAAAPADEKSVAVLAFANLSEDKSNEYFSDGISEELLNVLAKVPGLKVSARTSAFHFKGRNTPIPEIARQLGVAYVVEGSVRRAGDKVRITAQLIKAADGFRVWNDTFTRDLRDIFAVQDEIAGLIAKSISPQLTPVAAGAARPVDPAALELYLEGRALAAKASIDSLKRAIALFDRAVQRDPSFALARAQQARAYVQLGRWGGLVPRDAWAGAKAALGPALADAPDAPEVLVAQGWILRTADWRWREAERAFARALEQRPNDPDVLVSAAVLKAGIGRSDEAHALARRAVELDPLNPATQFDLGLIYRFSDRLPEAERQLRRAIELSPGGQRYRTFLALVVVGLGRFAEAEELARDEPDPLSRLFVQGLAAAGRRDGPRLRETIAELESLRPTMGGLGDYSAYLSSMRAAAGDLDGAMAELERTRESRDPSVGWIKVNYLVRPLHAHPRWSEFLRSVGLADDQLR